MSRTCCNVACRRAGRVAGWFLPAAVLVAMPKCPVCVAGYVMLATGMGLSFATASYLRISVIVVCIAAIACLALREVFTLMRKGPAR